LSENFEAKIIGTCSSLSLSTRSVKKLCAEVDDGGDDGGEDGGELEVEVRRSRRGH
jgi:hypothetical protein